MKTEPREPSRLPVRGTIATIGTAGALTLLLSFQGGPLAPSDAATAADEPFAADELITSDGSTATATDATIETLAVTGDAVATRWGDVQLEVTLEGGDIVEVVALQLPDSDRHTIAISEEVEPTLRAEAIASDSAIGLSVISGATYTSEAYAASLQSALDQADVAVAGAPAAGASDTTEPEDAAQDQEEEATEGATSVPVSDDVRTATGEAMSIRWGDVQVAVTVRGDDILDVETLAIPTDDRKSQRINSRAEPILREEAIAIDSSDVAVVSGATYTSEAYAGSLQSALDQLGF